MENKTKADDQNANTKLYCCTRFEKCNNQNMLHQYNPFSEQTTNNANNDENEMKCISYLKITPRRLSKVSFTPFRFYAPPRVYKCVCRCIRNDMYIGLYQWAKSGGECFQKEGLNDLFSTVWEQREDLCNLSNAAKEILAEALYSCQPTNKCVYAPSFCIKYFHISWEQSMVILYVLYTLQLTEYATSCKCSWPNDEIALKFWKDVDPLGTIKKRVETWIENVPCDVESTQKFHPYRFKEETICFMESMHEDVDEYSYGDWEDGSTSNHRRTVFKCSKDYYKEDIDKLALVSTLFL